MTAPTRKSAGALDVAALVAEHGNLISYPTAADMMALAEAVA